MKTKLRRIIAMALTVSMVTSMIGIIPAAAASSHDQIATTDGSSYAYYQQDGSKTTNAGLVGTDNPVSTAKDTKSDATVQVSKTIESTSTENQFNIELKVVTTQDMTELEVSEDAAVVIVMDLSGSMLYEAGSTGTTDADAEKLDPNSTETRLYAAKEAAQNFMTDFANTSSDSAQRMAAFVTFHGVKYDNSDSGVTLVQDWTNVAGSATSFNSQISKVAVDDDSQQTNIAAGLEAAEALLDDLAKENSDITNVYVILLSDGVPSEPYADDTDVSNNTTAIGQLGLVDDYGNRITASNATSYKGQYLSMLIAEDAADSLKAHSTDPTLYTICFVDESTSYYYSKSNLTFSGTLNDWLADSISTDADDTHFNSTDLSGLTTNLTDIYNAIKSQAEAWQVTDPMGQYINFVSFDSSDLKDNDATEKDGTITWDLIDSKSDTDKDGTTTFTLNYTIQLDTDALGFTPATYYLANGQTTLEYFFRSVDENGNQLSVSDNATIDFLVPAVCGDYPSNYSYTVNYWLQVGVDEDTGEHIYADTPAFTYTRSNITKFSTVTANPRTYGNYTLNTSTSDYGSVQITTNGQELNLYYDRNTTTATVNHYYYTVTETDAGTVVTLDSESPVYENLLYIGDKYEAATANKGSYSQITAEPTEDGSYTLANGKTTTITLVAQNDEGTENVVNYYYVYSIDNRTDVSIDVTHKYITYSWELNSAGRYVEVISDTMSVALNTITQKYGTSFTATQIDKEGFTYEGIQSSTGNFSGLSIDSLTKNSSITLYYEQHLDNPNELVDVTVNHMYYTETTSIDANGDTSVVTILTGETSTTTDSYRVGETYKASKDTTYAGNSYTQTSVSPSATIVLTEGDNEITFKYIRTVDARVTTSVTVYHDYTLYFGDIDEEGEYFLNVDEKEDMDYSTKYTTNSYGTLYAGMSFTATADNQGYTLTDVSPSMTITLDEKNNSITISYELTEDLDAADVTVEHYYKTDVKTYVDGSIVITEGEYQLGNTDSYEGHVGERYTATEIFSFDGNDDYVRDDANSLRITLGGASQTITLYYSRIVEDYEDTAVTVNHIFTTTSYYIDENGNKTSDTDSETFTFDYSTDENDNQLFAGMIYTAVEDATLGGEGFTASATNNETLLLVQDADDNVINLYYTKTETSDLVDASVEVIYHYTAYETTLVDGEPQTNEVSSFSTSWFPTVTGLYAGQFYTATSVTNGYDQITDDADYTKVQLEEGLNTIHIFYEKTTDETVPATLDVTHIYTTKYETGSTSVKTFYDETINSWSTVKHVFNVDTDEGLFSITDIDSDNKSVDDKDYTIVLEAGENAITIEYFRYVDDRTPTSVVVNHHYSTEDLYTGDSIVDGQTSSIFSVYVEDESFTATLVESYNDTNYDYVSGDKTIDINAEDSSLNVINLYYVKYIDTTPETPDTPDTPSYTYYSLTVTYVDEDGNEIADGAYTAKIRSGTAYSTTQKSIDGYSFLETQGDAPSGTIRSDKNVIYVYTADEVEVPETPDTPVIEIPDEDIPLSEIPEIPEIPELPELPVPPVVPETPETPDVPVFDIPDDDIPLSDIPQTGDSRNLSLLVTIALISAAGLSVVLKMEMDDKKKRSAN